MSKAKTPPKVEVVWRDACYSSEIHTTAEAEGKTPIELCAVGYLVKRHKDRIIIADEWDALHKQFRFVHVFPLANVLKVRYLR